VVLKEDAKGVGSSDLTKWCRDRLAAYKIPHYIEFRDMLPKSKVGKHLRREIRDEEKRKLQKEKRKPGSYLQLTLWVYPCRPYFLNSLLSSVRAPCQSSAEHAPAWSDCTRAERPLCRTLILSKGQTACSVRVETGSVSLNSSRLAGH